MKQRVQTYLLQKPVIISAWAFMAIALLIFLSDLLEIPRRIGMHTNMTGSWLDGTIDGVFILLVGAAASEMISRIDREKRQSEMKYSSLVEQANDSIVIIKNGEIVFANQKMTEITGFSLKEIGHRSFLEFISPEDRELVAARYQSRIAGENVPKDYETRLKIKDGTYLPAEINASLIEYEGVPARSHYPGYQ